MRLLAAVATVLITLGTGPVAAQVPDTLFTGTARPVASVGETSWCALEVGPTLFQRVRGKLALVTLPPLHYAETTLSGGTYFGLSGQAQMAFTNTTSGTLRFVQPTAYPATILKPKFLNYTEAYNAATGRLEVRFRLRFPDCALVVVANY